MICENCKAASDLMEAATALFDELAEPFGFLSDDDTEWAFYVAAAVVRLHTECQGGDAGCGCQHRGTQAVRYPAGSGRPTALITSPAVSA